jgi:hypothetical protein
LLDIPNLGPVSVKEIKRFLSSRNTFDIELKKRTDYNDIAMLSSGLHQVTSRILYGRRGLVQNSISRYESYGLPRSVQDVIDQEESFPAGSEPEESESYTRFKLKAYRAAKDFEAGYSVAKKRLDQCSH